MNDFHKVSTFMNDNEPFVLPWLRNLYPDAYVDGRSIQDVQARDVNGYDRVHLFAGIAGWEYALELAGWPDKLPVWTGSCPCQPFSTAGKRGGANDPRHLWPDMFRLISQCRPQFVFGEQVSSAIRHGWLDGISADLEAEGYTVGAAVLGAHSVGAPHIRQRLYWVAYTQSGATQPERHDLATEASRTQEQAHQWQRVRDDSGDGSTSGRLAYTERTGSELGGVAVEPGEGTGAAGTGTPVEPGRRGDTGWLGNTNSPRLSQREINSQVQPEALGSPTGEAAVSTGSELDAGRPVWDAWSDYDLIACLDGQVRRTESGLHPLAPRLPNTVGRIRAYGGSIVPQVAAVFIRAFMLEMGLAARTR